MIAKAKAPSGWWGALVPVFVVGLVIVLGAWVGFLAGVFVVCFQWGWRAAQWII